LKAINGIGLRARVPVGHMLLVPSQRPSFESADSLAKAGFTAVPAGRTFYYTVRRGDSLVTIATRYGVSASDLRQWNGMMQNHVSVGQKLRVVSDVGAKAGSRGKVRRATAKTNGVKAAPRPAIPPKTSLVPGRPTASAGRQSGG